MFDFIQPEIGIREILPRWKKNYPQIPQRKELSHQVTSLRASMGDFQEAPSGEREQDGKWER